MLSDMSKRPIYTPFLIDAVGWLELSSQVAAQEGILPAVVNVVIGSVDGVDALSRRHCTVTL